MSYSFAKLRARVALSWENLALAWWLLALVLVGAVALFATGWLAQLPWWLHISALVVLAAVGLFGICWLAGPGVFSAR